MSTDNGAAEKSNETKLFNQTINKILEFLKNISVCGAIISTIVQYLANKSASSFYGINSELFHSQPFWSIIIDFFAPALINLAILLTPLTVADCYRNTLKTIKERSNNKEKTLKILYPLLFTIIFFYPLLSGGYILYQYANIYDSINTKSNLIFICIKLLLLIITLVIIFIFILMTIILPFIIILLIKIYSAINKAQQAGKDKNWYLVSKCVLLMPLVFFILNNLVIVKLYHSLKIYIFLPLILCNFFMLYYLATLYFFLDENKLFSWTTIVCFSILFICTVLLPLSSGKTYYSGKKQYEIVEPISGSNIDSGSNLKVVILHKDNQLLLMDFTTDDDENTKDESAPSKEIEKQAKQSIEEILSKASASNLNIKKGEYTIQDENLYKFYTVTFNKVNCEK